MVVMRRLRLLFVLTLLALLCGRASAQYTPIPDEPSGSGCPNDPTQCSGYKVRADMNARLDGQSRISPFISGLAYQPNILTFSTQRNWAAGDTQVDFDATAGDITYTLPAWTLGMQLVFKRVDSTSNTVTILPSGSNTIDGSGSLSLLAKQAVTLGAGFRSDWSVGHSEFRI